MFVKNESFFSSLVCLKLITQAAGSILKMGGGGEVFRTLLLILVKSLTIVISFSMTL